MIILNSILRILIIIFILTINLNLTAQADAGPDQTGCTATYTLNGSDPGSGSGFWSVISGTVSIANPSSFNSEIEIPSMSVTLRWTVDDGSVITSDDVVITNDQVTASGTGFMTCIDNTQIIANNPLLQGATGVWTVDNQTTQIITDPHSYITSISGLIPNTINQLRWTVSRNACSASDTINIEYFVPNAKIEIADIVHGCADTVELIADSNIGSGIGIWSEETGNLAIIFDNDTYLTTVARNLPIASSTFIWTVTDRGCESSDQLVVNNSKPINTLGMDNTGCTNTFQMNAQLPTITGTGLWTLISGNVTFEDPTSATTKVTASSGPNIAQWSITDNGCTTSKNFTISNNLTTSNAGSDIVVCENRVNLSGNVLKPGESGQWSIDGGIISESFSNSTVNNPEVTGLRQGITTFLWSISNGICTSEDRVFVTNERPSVDAGADRTTCEDYVTLFGNNPNPGAIGVWTIGSIGVLISSPTAYNTIATNLSQGANLFTWTITNGICSNADNVLITRNTIDVAAGIPYSVDCADTFYLEATIPPSGATGEWIPVAGGGTFDNPTSYTTIARNLGSYNRLRWTITEGTCSFYDEIDFLNLTPTQAITQEAKSVCSGNTIITGNPPNIEQGESGLWTKITGFSSIIVHPTAFQTAITNLSQGENVFQWTISNSNCSTSDMIVITNNQVIADAGLDKIICDTVSTLNANILSGTGTWTSSTPGITIARATSANTSVAHLEFGNNNFQWTVLYNGCSDTDEIILTSNLPRNVSAGFDQEICYGETNLSASNPLPGKGLWTIIGGTGMFTDATKNQTGVTGLSLGENILRWTVTVGNCSASNQVGVHNNSLYVSAGTDQMICNIDSLLLDGTRPAEGIAGIWTVNRGTGIFDNPTLYNSIVRGISKGTNEFVWTLSDGNCSNSASLFVYNNTPDSAKVGQDQSICINTAAINALPVSNGSGKWSVKSGSGVIASVSSNNTTVSGINRGLNKYTWMVTKNDCSLSADIIVVNNSTHAYISDDDISICTPTLTTTIIGNALGINETGFWTKLSPSNGVISEPTNNLTTITNIANGESFYTWTIQNGVCTDSEVLKITNNYYHTSANVPGSNTLCVDYSPIIGGYIPIGATGLWTSTAPEVTFDNNSLVSTIVSNLPEGTSKLTWTITKDGCSSSASLNLLNNAVFSNAGKDTVIVDVSSFLLNGNNPALSSGAWTCSSSEVSFDNPTLYNAFATNIPDGQCTFIWTITNSCGSTSDEVLITKINSVKIINQPISQEINEGTSVTFSVNVNGNVIGYQWRKDGENLPENEKYKGTKTKQLTITNISPIDAGNYDCEITGIVNTEYSSIAILSVLTDIKELSRTGIKIYPNPSNGKFSIEFDNVRDFKNLRVTNLNGQVVFSKNILSLNEYINISNFQNGTYIINIQHNNETIQTKIVIQN